MTFGNGRYVGTYIGNTDTLTVDKLDFGTGSEVADVLFGNNQWYLAVNSGTVSRRKGQIYLWDAGALETVLADETGVGVQEIGFITLINGVVWLAYKDETESGFAIGYISGRQIVQMARYTGTLPTFKQKTLYRGMIMFLSSGLVWTAGAIVPELPFQLSQIASGKYNTLGAMGSPFGIPLIGSTNNDGSFSLAKLVNYTVDSSWDSIVFTISKGKYKGFIDEIIVLTNKLEAGASASLTIKIDQASGTSDAKVISTTGKSRHYFSNFGIGQIEDFKISLDFSNGSVTNPVKIRSIIINGHFVENT
jgi:hypothetical protein